MTKLITEQQAQTIVNYLAKKPYAEVFTINEYVVGLLPSAEEKSKDKKRCLNLM